MSELRCIVCDASGYGVQFPLLPTTQGFTFGTICVECDKQKEG